MSSLVVGTAGHIDHGKSSLVEALTGIHPDRLKEEQVRGITIDLGFAHATIGELVVSFVDVPGHERFVRNMLAGAGGIDAVILVVAADESVMPQTREHFDVCRLLGIERGLVALTKTDRVDDITAELVALEIRELVAGSFLDAAPIVPVSVRTGAGLAALRAELLALSDVSPRQARSGVVRLPVDRVFSVKGFGTVITGTLVSGHVRDGDELVALPETRTVRVRGVQMHGRSVPEAAAPRRVALNLGSVEVNEIARGVTLATADSLAVTQRIDVHIEVLPRGRELRHGARLQVHQGTAEATARLVLSAVRTASDAPWQLLRPGEAQAVIRAGGEAYGRLRLQRAMAVTRGDRLVLRAISPASTVGGAVVLDPEPPATALRRQSALDRFRALDLSASGDAAAAAAVRVWLLESGRRGLTPGDIVRRGGLNPEAVPALMGQLSAGGQVHAIGGRWFHFTAAPESKKRGVIPGHDISSSDEDVQARHGIEETVRQAGLGAPDIGTLQRISAVGQTDFERHVRDLIRERKLIRLDTLLFHADALAGLRADIQKLKQTTPAGVEVWLDVATFKARHGLSRKYAIPLLEWLDRERVTRRVGDRRLVLA